jgi:hypothetical protein
MTANIIRDGKIICIASEHVSIIFFSAHRQVDFAHYYKAGKSLVRFLGSRFLILRDIIYL